MRDVNDASDRSHISSPAILGALLLATARTVDLLNAAPPRNPTRPLGRHDKDIVAGVETALQAQFPDAPKLIAETVDEVASAIRFVRNRGETPSLAAAKYDAARTALLDRLGVDSAKGVSVWPPTSQTAVQRFGSWNDALTAAGLATSSVGRAKGQLRFDADAYDAAIAAFVADCESRGVPATYKEYGSYAGEHKGDVPSAAAVRKFYGSWNTALTSAG
ncbi:homing endonuclease associated repeat-containing protein [Brevibacterium metallidurans]|uniref:homing endonuclease associated repeat-containing protein n=1 Tax=Brevibacterium metallidurans TaxID=1482676 RepID=UPI0030DADBEA